MEKSKNNNNKNQTTNNKKIAPETNQESSANNAEKLYDSQNPKSKQPPTHHWWLDAIYFILGTLALGGIATLLGWPMFKWDYYPKPMGMAPDWLFSVAWTIIYIAIGVATFCMWRDKQLTSKDRKINLWLYLFTWRLI